MRIPLLALCLLLAAIDHRPGEPVLSASCGASCEPAAESFQVPSGHRACDFRILALRPGEPCSGGEGKPMAGFSIRSGRDTVLVYYTGPGGAVSDPVPLENLVLEPGPYGLYAVPARGASVTLSYTLKESKE